MGTSTNSKPSKHSYQTPRDGLYSKMISRTWDRSQIGRRSEYSIERLLAFRDYYERTSILRAFMVCALTPIPALLVALSIDCIPLKVPSDGWRANYAAWVRLFVMMAAISLVMIEQIRDVIVRGRYPTQGPLKSRWALLVATLQCPLEWQRRGGFQSPSDWC